MPQKPRVDVRLHVMVTPSQKSRIEGAAERLRETLGRPVSEAQVVRAAIEQTDFSKLALIAAPAADKEVQRERTTLTPEQAAIIEAGGMPHHFIAGGPPGPVEVHRGFMPGDDSMVPQRVALGMPVKVEFGFEGDHLGFEVPENVKHAFVNWASEDPLVSDVPDEVTDWLEDEIVPDPEDRTGIPEGVTILAERPQE